MFQKRLLNQLAQGQFWSRRLVVVNSSRIISSTYGRQKATGRCTLHAVKIGFALV